MDLNKLASESHRIAKEHGWLDKPRSWAGTVALMHSELSEALEDYRNGKGLNETYYEGEKPCGIPVELADVVIRVAQHFGTEGWKFRGVGGFLATKPNDFEELIAEGHLLLSKAYSNAAPLELEACVQLLVDFSASHNIDLPKAIEEKAKYNETRSYRHGNKKI